MNSLFFRFRQLGVGIGGVALAVLLLAPVKNISAQEVVLLRPGNASEVGLGETIVLFHGNPADRWIAGIQTPTLTVLLAPPERAKGAAVIICPGGGYGRELYDREGLDVARWLNRIGVAGIVLKYRLPTGKYSNGEDAMPLQDALRAVRLVRSRAAEWKLDAGKIGLMGFSAGGHVAATAGTLFDDGSPTATDPVERLSSRADFLALIYPQISMQPDLGRKDNLLLGPNPSAELLRKYSPELQITPRTPPSFLLLCGDDPYLNPEHVLRFYQAARRAGVPAELHLYETGGHGFGVQGIDDPGAKSWPHRFEAWLAARFPAIDHPIAR